MLDNNTYNLMLQITQEQKSLWRMKKYYIYDSKECPECKDFWTKFMTQKKENIAEMKKLLQKHIA
ncbi:MAG: hypothetical protein Q8O13_00320 [Candidatus Omnitrophota bacterium]|nr:hypothetical protein [Candidatus Omnitrophota bacterium]